MDRILPKCEFCNIEIDTRTNRAKFSDGYWSYMCKSCYQNRFMAGIRAYQIKQKEKETGCGF
jgi:hypothetical protein